MLVVVGAVSVSEYGFAALMLTICVGSLWEFYRMAAKKGLSVDRVYPVAVGGVAVAMSFLVARGTLPVVWLSIFFPLLYVIFVYELRRRPPEPFIHIAVAVGGLVYAALPMSLMCFVAFYGGSYDAWTILCYIFTVWVNDIFAYLTGVLFGKHKMFERVSPKKSWEGFAGGLLFAVAFGVRCGLAARRRHGVVGRTRSCGRGQRRARRPGRIHVQAVGGRQGFGGHHSRTRRVYGPFRCIDFLRTVCFRIFYYLCRLVPGKGRVLRLRGR